MTFSTRSDEETKNTRTRQHVIKTSVLRVFAFKILFLFLVFVMIPEVSLACSCIEMTPERSAQIIDEAALIFEGRIVGLKTIEEPEENFDYDAVRPITENPFFAKARLKILDLYKGIPDGERVTAYIDTMTSCGYYFQTGDVATFMLNEHENVLVQTDICNTPLQGDWEKLQAGEFK